MHIKNIKTLEDFILLKLSLIQLSLGPTAIKIKKTPKKGIINLLKNGGPIEIFSFIITSKNIG